MVSIIFCLRFAPPDPFATLNEALDKCADIIAPFVCEVRMGAGAYVCGEETSLLNSLEGKVIRANRTACERLKYTAAELTSLTHQLMQQIAEHKGCGTSGGSGKVASQSERERDTTPDFVPSCQ